MPGVLQCPQCGANLSYKTVSPPARARCPKCHSIFQTAAESDVAFEDPATSASGGPTESAAAVPPPLPLEAGAGTGATTWYYSRGGVQFGPFDEATIRRLAHSGTVGPDDYVWNETLPEWTVAHNIPNLFAAPSAVPGVPLARAYAGFWLRLLAFIIDNVVLLAAGAVLGIVMGLLFVAVGAGQEHLEVTANVVGLLVTWLYYALCERSAWQGTLGKKALGLVVTDLYGNRISFGRATGRHFAKILSAIILLIGFIMAGFTDKKQALHDMIAGCVVVRRR